MIIVQFFFCSILQCSWFFIRSKVFPFQTHLSVSDRNRWFMFFLYIWAFEKLKDNGTFLIVVIFYGLAPTTFEKREFTLDDYYIWSYPANPDVFEPKIINILREIKPKDFSSLGSAVSEELHNKQTDRLTRCCYRIYQYTYNGFSLRYSRGYIWRRR